MLDVHTRIVINVWCTYSYWG